MTKVKDVIEILKRFPQDAEFIMCGDGSGTVTIENTHYTSETELYTGYVRSYFGCNSKTFNKYDVKVRFNGFKQMQYQIQEKVQQKTKHLINISCADNLKDEIINVVENIINDDYIQYFNNAYYIIPTFNEDFRRFEINLKCTKFDFCNINLYFNKETLEDINKHLNNGQKIGIEWYTETGNYEDCKCFLIKNRKDLDDFFEDISKDGENNGN